MQHLLFKVGTIFYSIWKMAQLNKLRGEKFFKNNQGTTLESRLQHYPKNICTQILLQGKCLHDKQFTNKRIPIVFEILFWLLQWKSAFSSTHKRAQSPDSCVPLGKHWSCSLPIPHALSRCGASLSLPAGPVTWLEPTNAVPVHERAWIPLEAWHPFRFISWNTLIAFFRHLIYTFH